MYFILQVLEQPLDFTHLAEKYSSYITGFIHEYAHEPFLLYMCGKLPTPTSFSPLFPTCFMP